MVSVIIICVCVYHTCILIAQFMSQNVPSSVSLSAMTTAASGEHTEHITEYDTLTVSSLLQYNWLYRYHPTALHIIQAHHQVYVHETLLKTL